MEDQFQMEFNFNGENTIIQCGKNDKLKDIYKSFRFKSKSEEKPLFFMYNGITIQKDDLAFEEISNSEDKKRKKMNILVIEAEAPMPSKSEDAIIKSKNIICPECKEDIKFSIEDYIINLFECKNKHDIDNIYIEEFDSTQNINISKINCEVCGKYNKGNVYKNIFYRCNTCKKNMCPICHSMHDKEHYVINYDDKNYICEKHNKIFMAYCEDCKSNICMYCEQKHNEHNIINYGKLIPEKNKMNDLLNHFLEKKNKLDDEIDKIIKKLNKVKENLENYYNIINDIINNFDREKINYEILYNINNINNNDIINDINNIINENNIENKFNQIINIYNKMTNINKLTIIYNNNFNLKLFGENFVKNNSNNSTMIINRKEYKLSEKFNIKNLMIKKI